MRKLYETMMQIDGPELELRVERTRIDPDASFSREAMDRLNVELATWVGTRIMRRWQATGDPPTALVVTIKVEPQ